MSEEQARFIADTLRDWLLENTQDGSEVVIRRQNNAFTVLLRPPGWEPTRVSHTGRILSALGFTG